MYIHLCTYIFFISVITLNSNWLDFHPNDFSNGVFFNRQFFYLVCVYLFIAQPRWSHRLRAFTHASICIRLFGSVCSLWHLLLFHKAAAIILGVKGAPRNARPSAPRTTQSTCVCHGDTTQTHTQSDHRNLDPD